MGLIRKFIAGKRFRDRFSSDTPIIGVAAVNGLLYVVTSSRIYGMDDKGKLMPIEYSADIAPPDEE